MRGVVGDRVSSSYASNGTRAHICARAGNLSKTPLLKVSNARVPEQSMGLVVLPEKKGDFALPNLPFVRHLFHAVGAARVARPRMVQYPYRRLASNMFLKTLQHTDTVYGLGFRV